MASSLLKLDRSAEALPIIDECLRLARGKVVDPDLLPGVVGLRLQHFERRKDVGGCRTTAEMWEKQQRSDAASLYQAACCRAVTAKVIRATDQSTEATKQANAEAGRAMAWLQKAIAAGYKDLANPKKSKDLDALRGRADFQKLMAEMKPGR